MKIDFCLPIYNEEKIIADSLRQLYAYLSAKNFPLDWKIIVINNGSSDQSEKIVRSLENDKIRLVNISQKGKGRALKTYWMDSAADIVAFMDSDLAVTLEDIDQLVFGILDPDTDVIIGSRHLPDSRIDRSILREIVSRSCNIFFRIIVGYHISDTQCGFKAIKKEKFMLIAPFIKDDRWFFDTEIIAFAKFFGLRLNEIPVVWKEERYDQRHSKIKIFRDSWLHFKNLIHLRKRLKELRQKRKMPITNN
jgi:glycosyltransferase involved in cell wall biosynthesis